MRLSFVLFLIFCTNTISSQTYLVEDSITGNLTKYIHLHDSIYRFVSTFNGRVITEGKIIDPDLTQHVKHIYRVQNGSNKSTHQHIIANYSDHKLIDTCSEYDLRGLKLIEFIVIPDRMLIISYFTEGRLNTTYFRTENGMITRYFDIKGNITYEENLVYNLAKTSIQYKNGEKIKREFIYDIKTSEFKPIGNYHKQYFADNKSYEYTELDDKTQLMIAKGTYNHELGLRWDQTFKYNENKKCIEQISKLYNEKTNVLSLVTVIHSYDKKGRLINSTKMCKNPQPGLLECEDFKFTYDVNKGLVKYHTKNVNQTFSISNNGISMSISDLDSDSFIINATPQEIHTTRFGKGIKRESRHRIHTGFIFPERYNDSTDAFEFVSSLLHDGRVKDEDIYLNGDHYQEVINGQVEPMQDIYFTDTFFDCKGKDSMIYVHKNDTIMKYAKIEGQYQLAFHSHYLRIAKDFHLCAVGLKNSEDKWVIPAKYTTIAFNKEDEENLYYCRYGDKTDIYNWKAEVVGYDLEHLMFIDQYGNSDEPYMSIPKRINVKIDSLGDTEPLLFVENDNSGIYKLIQLNGNTVIEFPSKFKPLNSHYHSTDSELLFYCMDENGKYAIFNLNGQLTEYKFDGLKPFRSNTYLISENEEIYLMADDFKTKLSEKFIDLININDSISILKHQDENVTIFNSNKKTNSKIELHYKIVGNTIIKDHFYISNKNGNLFGMANLDLSIKIKPEYSQIHPFDSGYIGNKNGQYDVYDNNGHLLKSYYLDSIFNLDHNFGEGHYHYTKKELLFTQKGQRYGLINKNFETILEPGYSNILECEKFFMFCRQEDTTYVDFDYQIIKNVFPRNQYLFFRNFFDQNQGLLNSKGQLVAYPIHYDIKYSADRFDLTPIFQNKPLYLVDIEGNIKIDLSSYNDIREFGQYYYIQKRNGLSGVMERNGRIKIKPEHLFLAYDVQNELLWFNCMPVTNKADEPQNTRYIWQLKSLKTGQISKDTFEKPLTFISNKCLLRNQQKKFGVIDTKLNILIAFEYDAILDLYPYLGFKKQDTVLITDSNFRTIKRLFLKHIGQAEKYFWGFHKGKSYLYDSSFTAIDSSLNNFSNSKRILTIEFSYRWTSIKSNETFLNLKTEKDQIIEEDNLEIKDEEYLEEYYNEIENIPDTIGIRKINNALATLYFYTNSTKYNNIYKELRYFPVVYGYLDEFYELSVFDETNHQQTESKLALKSTTSKVYKPVFLSIEQIEATPINVLCYTDDFITFRYDDSYNSDDFNFHNIYIDDVLGFAQIYLYDLIDPSSIKTFNKMMFEKLSKLEDPDIPCYPKTDYMELFQNNFIITSNGIIFYLNDTDYRIKFEFSELRQLLREYWKNKI